jgi:excisionase family DNA binding protein
VVAFSIAEHFYTLTQAAERLGVERHTVWRWIKAGRFQVQKAGGVVFIERSAIELARRHSEAGA